MNRRLEISGYILAELLNYTLVMALQVILFLDVAGWWPGNIRIFLPALLPVFFYLAREFCGSRLLFFALHILIPWGVAVLWGRNLYEKAIFGISVILLSLISIHRRLTKQGQGCGVIFPLAAAAFFFGFYLLDWYQTGGANIGYLIRFMIWYALIYFLHLYLMHFRQYMDVNHRTTENIPVNRAFYSSFGLVMGFLVISAAAICLGADRELFEAFGALVKKWLLSALSFLFSLLPKGGEAAGEIEQAVQDGGGMMEMMPPLEESGPSLLSKLLEGLFFLLGAAATAAVFGAVFLSFFRLINAAFERRERKTGEKRKEGEGDKVEKLARPPREKKKPRRELTFPAARTPQQIMRRLYFVSLRRKYYIKRAEKEERLLRSGTARECCGAMFPEKKEEAEEFAGLYERARYGREACLKEDAKRMKHLSGELLK